jgi:hypothetical protein
MPLGGGVDPFRSNSGLENLPKISSVVLKFNYFQLPYLLTIIYKNWIFSNYLDQGIASSEFSSRYVEAALNRSFVAVLGTHKL